MNLIIYVNEDFEEEKSLFDLSQGKSILRGDYYHDKIDGQIEGYLKALNEHEIYRGKVHKEYINSEHKHFNVIGFCCF